MNSYLGSRITDRRSSQKDQHRRVHPNHTRHYREQPLPGRGRGHWHRPQSAVCHLAVADPGGPD